MKFIHDIDRASFIVILYFSMLLCVLPIMQSCSNDDYEVELSEPILPNIGVEGADVLYRDSLRILDIGNSYSYDGMRYLGNVIETMNISLPTVCLYQMVRGGASICDWYNCYFGKDEAEFSIHKVVGGMSLDIPTGTFDPFDNTTFSKILDQEWDLIILHQASEYAINAKSWNSKSLAGCLPKFMSLLKQRQEHAVFAFTVIHSYSSDYEKNEFKSSYERWQKIVANVDIMLESYPVIQLIVPYGTAIEKLRSTNVNNSFDLTRDGTHLGYGLPLYTASLCYYETLIAPRIGKSIQGQNFTYKCTPSEQKGSFFPSSFIDVTPDNVQLAISAVLEACRDYKRIYN